MSTEVYFVDKHSIVRSIWGNSDTIMVIFAGASAEFALNKAVDWLYFTGKLPADPLGRLFSTVSYAKQIVFSTRSDAEFAIRQIHNIHTQVEENRGAKIPDWAYRDVLYMLVDYSIRSYELLERRLSPREREEVYQVFRRVGLGMKIKNLPTEYAMWVKDREIHIQQNLEFSKFTPDLFNQYRKHLGKARYAMLREIQKLVLPDSVRGLLGYNKQVYLIPLIKIYQWSRKFKLDVVIKKIILPKEYQQDIEKLNMV